MRRADRLFMIVQALRRGRVLTAKALATELEVSERTIYRDIADLQGAGVPIDGEAGVGYVMRPGFDLPPLMFTIEEVSALAAGVRMIMAFGGDVMSSAARGALDKIETVLPEDRARAADGLRLFVPPFLIDPPHRALIDRINGAVERNEVIELDYADEAKARTKRCVRPLALVFWGKAWTLIGWCELRNDFRMFRVDRIDRLSETGRIERPIPEQSLAEYYRLLEQEACAPLSADMAREAHKSH
ncbi:YafY family protein [Notoacmeibacter sp. MSK16QG-6]|uniref:helix-turn-helix transcriptional regulator n=1 Tax=Notoacmeibacter sp. MSK16QG-6 TaxID=2957982 RepID=UPI0020A1FD54|nr:YafY family protein [Notoacmeibacter sp. MSK16QG-6]MCP1200161.1 YafY family transcriptional regulator [Notoacmeibacter sp. MSK16QG-6]